VKRIKIAVRPTGIRFLYDDRLKLAVLGPVVVMRASNVEWDNLKQGWTVELADGTQLPGCWAKRDDALAAEVTAIHATL